MATEAEIPEPLSTTQKREGEDKNLTSRQLDRSVDDYWPGESTKVEGGCNQPPETVEHSANTDAMQAAIHIGVETVSTVLKGNVGTFEGESFLKSPSVANIASEETCRVSEHHQADEISNQAGKEILENEIQLQKDQKFGAIEEAGSGENEVMEETKEMADKGYDNLDIASFIERDLQKTEIEEPALKVETEETLNKERILDQNAEVVMNQQAFIEENPQSIEEAISGSRKDERETGGNTDSESSKQFCGILEATTGQNKEASDQTSDFTVDSLSKDVETVTEASNREESINNILSAETTFIQEKLEEINFKGEEDKESEKFSNIVRMEKGPEEIRPSEEIKDEKDEGKEIPHDGITDICNSTLTENLDIQNDAEASLEIGESDKDKLDSPTLTLVEDNTPVGDEMKDKNSLDAPFVIQTEEICLHKVEKPEMFKEVLEIGSEGVVKEILKEAEEQTEILTAQTDGTTSAKGKDDENPEQELDDSFIELEESMQNKGEELPMTEASAGENRIEDKFTVVAEENIGNKEIVEAKENREKETSKHEEDPEQTFLQHDEPKKEEPERSLNLISEVMETATLSENSEKITCVKEEKSIKNLEESLEEKCEEDKPTETGDISEHGITTEMNFPPVDLNEKHKSAEVEIPEKNINDLHDKNSFVEETEQVECEKLYDVSKFEPQEQADEANRESTKEEKQIEEESEPCKSTESTTLEHTPTDGAATKELISSKIDNEKLQKIFGLDSEEKLQVEDAGESIEEETQKNEEAFDTETNKIATKGDGIEKARIEKDAPLKACSTVGAGDETVDKSFQVESLEKAAQELSGDNKTYKAEEVNDGTKITGTGEVTEDNIIEGNVRPSEKMKDERHEGKQTPYDGIRDVSISTLTENPDIQNNNEAILETREGAKDKPENPPLTLLEDETPVEEEIQDKNNLNTPFVIPTEEMLLQKVDKPEIFKEVSEIGSEDAVQESPKEVEDQTEILEKTAQADSTRIEKGKDDENPEGPEQKLNGSFIKYEESVHGKAEGLVTAEASAGENKNEEKFTVLVTEDSISSTEIIEPEEHRKKETSKHEEDPDQSFLQLSEPKTEKLERSLNVISETMETSASCENAETITCIKENRSIKNLEESHEEKGQEHKPADIDGISEHGIPKEENFPPVDLNKKIESAEVEIPEKNVNDLHVTHSLVKETEGVECERLDEVSKFQPQEVNEANGASAEEEKQIEEASEACKSIESTTSEHTSIEEAATRELISSKIDAEKLQKIYGLDFEEKLGVKDAGENIDEETQKNEEAIDTEMHKIATKSDDNEKAIIEGDASVKVCSTVGAGDGTANKSFQVEILEEAAPELSVDNKTYKAEEDVERKSIIDEEVHDGPKITGTGEVAEDYIIEDNVRPSEKMKDEKHEGKQTPYDGIRDVSISSLTENPDIQNDNEAILETGEGAKEKPDSRPLSLLKDETPVEDEIQDKNNLNSPFVIQTEEMFLQQVEKPEIFKEVTEIGSEDAVKESPKEVEDQTEILEKTTQADSTTIEEGKDDENPKQELDGTFINYEESVQSKGWLAKTEASAEESSKDKKLTAVMAEDRISKTEIVETEENRKKETSKHEEDPDQSFLQHDEPKKEKLERSLNELSETMVTSASCENAETINCVKEDRSNKILEESYEEKEKEDKAADTNGSSEHRIPREENFPPADLNKEVESAEVQIQEKNVNDLNVTHSLVEETEQVECEKLDEFSNFQPQEVNEANGASAEEEKKIEAASEACKSTESTNSEHTSTEEAATRELITSIIDDEKPQKIHELDSEEKLEVKDDGENTEEETQKNEAIDTEMHKIATKSDDTEKSIIEEDAPTNVCSAVGTGDETDEQRFQAETLEEAAATLSGDTTSYKAEDDVERNNIIDEEVHDGPKTTGTGEVIKEHVIAGNIIHISPESIEEETVKSLQDNEKEAERSKGEGTKEQITEEGNLTDLSPQSVAEGPVKNFQGDEKEAENFKGESSEEFGTAEAGESIACETNQDDKSPEKICYASSVKKDESLQEESEHLSPTEALEEEKREDDGTSVIITGDEDNITGLVKVEENSEKETSRDDEDAKQIFQQDEQDEKLERSLDVMSEEIEEGVSSENADKITCKREEGSVQNPEETLGKEMEEEAAQDKTEETAVQNLEETPPESTGEETSKISEENEKEEEKPKVEETLERSLNVISEMMETSASCEYAETINCVKEDRSIKNLEESYEENGKEDKPADTDGSSEHRFPREENFPPVDLNKKIESTEVEIPEKSVNDLNVTHSLVEEIEQVECENLDEVSNIQPQEVNEANGTSAEQEKQVEEASQACKSTESTSLEHTSTEEAETRELIASKIDTEKPQKIHGLDSEEKLEAKDDGENTEEETKKNEAIDTEMHKITTKRDDTEKSIIEEDAPAKVCSTVGTGDETVEQSFQVETLEEAAAKLSSDTMSYKAEDDIERNNVIDEEVHDGPKTTSTGEVIKEHIIEGNISHISAESIEEETVKSFQDNETEAEKSKGEDTKEHITEEGNVIDLSAESVAEGPVKNFRGDEKEAENFKGESFEKFETEEAGESVACETNQDDKSPEKICYASSVKKDESLQREGEHPSPTEALEEEKIEDDETSVVITGDEDNITGLVKVEENSKKETSKDDEDAEQIFQHDKPDEKLERSLDVMSEEIEEGVSSENADKITRKRELGVVQHPEEILEKEMEEGQAKDNREEAAVQNFEEISPESTGEETSKISEENEKDEEKPNVEMCEELEKTSVNEGIDKQNLEEEKTIENESTVPARAELKEGSSKEDDIVAEMPKQEVCEIIQTADTGKQIMEEDSAVKDDFEPRLFTPVNDGPKITSTGEVAKKHIIESTIRYISPELIEEETVKIFQDNENVAESSKGEDTKEQIIEEGNVIDLSSESTAEGPAKIFQDDEKEAEKFKGEIFEESETAKAGESVACETNQEEKSPEKICYASSVKEDESLQEEGRHLSPTEAFEYKKREDDGTSVVITGDDDNITGLVKVEEESEKETSKDDEEAKQIFQQDKPDEKLERSLDVMSEEIEEGVSNENAEKINCKREGVVQHSEEILEKEMEEEQAKDNTEEAAVQNLEEISPESMGEETSKISEENEKDEEKPNVEMCEELETTSVNEGIDKQNLEEEKTIENESTLPASAELNEESSKEDDIVAEMPKQEECEIIQTADTGKQIMEEDSTVKVDFEVNDGPKITSTGEVAKEHIIESTIRYISPELIEEETVKIFQDNENVAESSKGEDTKEQIIEEGNVIDLSSESTAEGPAKIFQDDEKEAEKFKGEIFEESETAKTGESVACETNQEEKSPEKICYASSVKEDESLQEEGRHLSPTEAFENKKREDDGTSVVITGDDDNITGLVKVEEESEKETSKDDEDAKQIFQQDKPDEKLERSLDVMSEEIEEGVSNENAEKINCKREGVVQHPEEILEKEMEEEQAKDNTEEEAVQNLEEISPESMGEETSKISEENEKDEEKPNVEMCEELETTSVNEGIDKQNLEEEKTTENESTLPARAELNEESSKEDDIVAEMPKQEECEIIQTADTGKQITEEDSTVKDNFEVNDGLKITSTGEVAKEHIIESTIRHISPKLIEQETVKIFQDNENEAESSKREDTKEQIIEEGNVIDLSSESTAEGPVKNFQDDEKEAEKFKGEIFEESEIAKAGETVACETNQDDKSPEKIYYASSVEEDESLPEEGEHLSPTEAMEDKKRKDDGTSVVITGDENNITGLVKVEENSEKETSKDDEDAKQMFQQDKPDEKLERSLDVMYEEIEEGFSSENAHKITCKREDGAVQHPEEILEKEMEEEQAKDNRGEAAVQNLEEISPESMGEETSKISEENEKDEEKPNVEMCEELETTSVNEGIDKQNLEEEKTNENESTVPARAKLNEESSKEDDIVAKMPKQEVCEIIQTADTGKHIMEEDSAVKDSIEMNDGPKITSTGEVDKEHIIETTIRYISPELVEEETVKIFQDNENEAESSKREDTKEQIIEESNVIDLSSESTAEGPVKNFQDDEKEVEKFKGEIFEESEAAEEGECIAQEINQADEIPERIFYASSIKQEVQGEGGNPSLMEALKEEKNDEDGSSVQVTGYENITRLVKAKENIEKATSKDDEDAKQILQQDEPGEKLEQLLNVKSKETEEGVSSENTERITSTREEASVQNLEETLEIEMKEEETKDTHDTKEDGIAKDEQDPKLVSEAFEESKSTESTISQQNLKESEIEVEKLKRECELDSKEEFEGKNASENIEEETKNEETSDICLHKVETKYASTEESIIEDNATIKDSPTVCIEDEAVELICQEDEKTQKGAEEAEPKTKDGEESCKTDNEPEYLKNQSINEEVYEGPKIAGMGEDTEKHIIQEEHTVIEVSPESIEEETSKSSEEDEKGEERPKVEMCGELETTSAGEGIEKQNLEEENAIKNQSIEPHRLEINEESSKDDMVVEMPKQEVCEIIEAANKGEDTGKQIVEEKSAVTDNPEVFEITSAGQDTREQIIKEIDSVKDHPKESIEKETLVESYNKDEEGEGFETAASSTNTEKQNKEECATPDLSSFSVGEETAEESSKEDESDAIKLKEGIEATGSTEETLLETLGDRAETNKHLDALNTTETSEEETQPKESNESLVGNSLVSKVSEKEIKTEILEKEEPTINDSDSASVTILMEEKCLEGAEPEDEKENLESADLSEKLECTSKSVAEDQRNKLLPEISQTQIEENDDVQDQNTETVKQQISGQRFQECEKEMNEQEGPKQGDEDHIKETQNANETIKDVILTEKVPEGSGEADENENIKELIIQEESDRKELHTVSAGDEIDNEVKNSDPVSMENLKATNSNEQIETMNLEVEEHLDREQEASLLTKASENATMEKGDNEKTIDDFILVSEVPEEKIKEEILEQGDDCYDKLDTTTVTVETEKNLEGPEKTININSEEASKCKEILDTGSSDKNADDIPTTRSLRDEILPEVGEKCEEASNLELGKMDKIFESASEVQSHDVLTKSGETEIKEEHLEAAMIVLNAEENQFEANEIIMNEVSNEKIEEKKEVIKGSHSAPLGEDSIKEIHQEDELKAEEQPGENAIETLGTAKNEIQSDELSEETEKTSASKNIIKPIAHEDRALRDPYIVSAKDKTVTESLPDEAEEQNVEKAAIKLNLENQGDTTNFRDSKTEATTQSEEVNIELEKHDLDTSSTNDRKETAITKIEEGLDTNLRGPPETNAAAKEAPYEKVIEEIEKASEPYPKEQVAEALADNPENLVEGEKHKHTSLELAWDKIDVKEDLKLEGQEVYDNKGGTSSVNEKSQEEILDKNSKFTEDDEKQHDWEFDKKAAEVSITAEGKGIKEEREHTEDEEPLEVSMRENERKPDQAEIQSTIYAYEETEIQDQSEKADDLAHIQDLRLVISQKEGGMVPAEANETTQEIQKIEKTSYSISEKQILREADPGEIAETMVSTGDKDALLVAQDPIAKSLQKAEVKDLEPGIASEIDAELNEETTKEFTSNDAENISLSKVLQRSTKETMQRAEHVTKEKEPTANKEKMQTEEVETLQVEAAKSDEEKEEEEEGDEHKKADSGSDAPVMVEASRDMDVKTPHKKSHHNILSGVGSKVKHSIAKVKKAITGKSSHSKTQPPKQNK